MTTQSLESTRLRLFPSHAWAYGHRRHGLHDILAPWKRGVDFEDYSVPSSHPVHTKSVRVLAKFLGDRIRLSDVLLVMAGMYVNHSDWIDIEIAAGATSGVPIIPVLDNGQERVPAIATRFAACEPVRWRGQSIRDAILAHIKPERRRAFELAVQTRANLERIRQQKTARLLSARLPTLAEGGGSYSTPLASPLPVALFDGPTPPVSPLAKALAGPELPGILTGRYRGLLDLE